MKFTQGGLLSAALLVAVFSADGNVSPAPAQPAPSGFMKTVVAGTAHDALYGLSFDGGKGVAVGVGMGILESDDGGLHWKRAVQNPTPAALLAVDRRGGHVIAVGQAGTVVVEEAGQWKVYDAPSKSRLFGVSINAAGTAVAVGEFGTVISSSDGGQTWASIAPASWDGFVPNFPGGNAQPHVYAVHIDDAGSIMLAGEFGIILESKDGGKNWHAVRAGDNFAASLFALYLPEKGDWFAIGQKGDIERSADHGKTWKPVVSGTESNLLGIAAKPGDQEFVITGMRVMLHSTDGGATWAIVNEGDSLTDWYQAVRTDLASGRIEAVGHSGKIIEIGG